MNWVEIILGVIVICGSGIAVAITGGVCYIIVKTAIGAARRPTVSRLTPDDRKRRGQ